MNKLMLVCVALGCIACTEVYKDGQEPTTLDFNVHVDGFDDSLSEDLPSAEPCEEQSGDDQVPDSGLADDASIDEIVDAHTDEPDAEVLEPDAGADAEVPEQDDEEEGDAAVVLPTLDITYDGPARNYIYMNEPARMYCLSVHANGAEMNVALPSSEIHGVYASSRIRTNSRTGSVFGAGNIMEGHAFVARTGDFTVTDSAIVYHDLPKQAFKVKDGETRQLCVELDVLPSSTPEDFYGQTYVFVMSDWTAENAWIAETGKSLSREQINFPRAAITANPMTILSRDNYYDEPHGAFSFCQTSPGSVMTGCCTTGNFVRGEGWPAIGELIKGSGAEVYYHASNGKRYVFPTSDVLASWSTVNGSKEFLNGDSSICRAVREYSDDVLARTLIGGNVTMRPGSYLVRIATDPKVYAISQGRILRWVGTQPVSGEPLVDGVVQRLFPDADRRVRILPDAFFVNYLMGSEITIQTQYSVVEEFGTTIELELGLH